MIYVNIVLTFFEFCWVLTGSVWTVKGLIAKCIKTGNGIEITDIPLYSVLGVIIVTWIGLAVKIVITVLSFNASSSSDSESNNESFLASDSSKSLTSKIFSVFKVKTRNINLFKDVAVILNDVFDDESFVPTDIAAALILTYAKHQNSR